METTDVIAGILAAIVIVQEIRIHRLTERLLIQAHVPDLDPVPVRTASPPEESSVEKINRKRKLFSVTVPD